MTYMYVGDHRRTAHGAKGGSSHPRIFQIAIFGQKKGNIGAKPLELRASNRKKYSGKRLQPPWTKCAPYAYMYMYIHVCRRKNPNNQQFHSWNPSIMIQFRRVLEEMCLLFSIVLNVLKHEFKMCALRANFKLDCKILTCCNVSEMGI